MTDNELQYKAYAGAMALPRPFDCGHMSDGEYSESVTTLIGDLFRLAKSDGCIAAAWTLSLLATVGANVPAERFWDEVAPLLKKRASPLPRPVSDV